MAVATPTSQIVFSGRLLRQLLRRKENNVFVSPASLGLALGMAAAGARGETLRALENTLGVDARVAANRAKRLFASLGTLPPGVQVELASSLWVRSGLRLSAEYAVAMREGYRAEVRSLDFTSAGSVRTVNDWVARQTHGRIEGIVESIGADSVLLLINATFFHGPWEQPFDPDETVDHEFTTAAGRRGQIRLMRRSDHFDYMESEHIQAVRLTYKDRRFSLLVVLPRKPLAVEEFDGLAQPESLVRITAALQDRRGFLGLPRVQLAYRADLVPELLEMGIGPALGDDADFSEIFEGQFPATISKVLQKTRLAIDEVGTTASAATGIEMRALGMSIRLLTPPFEMIVDRPFLLMLVGHETDLPLFIGVIGDPTQR
jgi:serpin B